MQINKSKVGDVVIIELKGRLDNPGSEILELYLNQIDPIIDNSTGLKLILDFKNVEYISSAGFRVLMLTLTKLEKRSGSIALCSLNKTTLESFNISTFDKLFTITGSREEALDLFN